MYALIHNTHQAPSLMPLVSRDARAVLMCVWFLTEPSSDKLRSARAVWESRAGSAPVCEAASGPRGTHPCTMPPTHSFLYTHEPLLLLLLP